MALDALANNKDMMITHSWTESGHATKSYHYKGRAVDALPKGIPYLELAENIHDKAKKLGLTIGLGLYPFWTNQKTGRPMPGIHLDNGYRGGKSTYWYRDALGKYHYDYNFYKTQKAVV